MISEAIEYPLEGEESTKRLAIGGGIYLASGVVGFFGGVLSLVPIVGWVLGPLVMLLSAVPTVIVGGYSVAVSRAIMAGETEPPAFEAWGEFVGDGLYVLGIFAAYAVPGVVLGVVGLVLFGVASLLPAEAGAVVVLLLTLVGGAIGVVYALAYAYVAPAALVNYARTDRLSAAWDVDTLRTVLTDTDYAVAWALGAVVLLIGNSVGSSLTWIVVGFAVFFFAQIAGVYVFTRGVLDALDEVPEPPSPPSSPADGADDEDTTPEAADGDEGPTPEGAEDDGATTSEDGEGDGATTSEDGEGDGDESAVAPPGGEVDRDLDDVSGVGPTKAEALRGAGYETVADLRAASREDLAEVEGVGPALADRIKNDVGGE